MNESRFNRGVEWLGFNIVEQYIVKIANFHKGVIFVSVGSGTAKLEHDIAQKNPDSTINWLCIDPNPASCEYIKPKYSYVDDLIKAEPSIIGNCIVFLNWCNPNDSTYDFEAIKLLKPISVLSVYEKVNYITDNSNLGSGYGAAGGIQFHVWIDKIDRKIKDDNEFDLHDYTKVSTTQLEFEFSSNFNPRISWWSRSSYELLAKEVCDYITESIYCERRERSDECIVS